MQLSVPYICIYRKNVVTLHTFQNKSKVIMLSKTFNRKIKYKKQG